MELHALDRELAMAQAHHQPVFRFGGHLEHVGHGVALHDERVVARRGERARQTGEHAHAVVPDLRGLAVHHARRAHDVAAVELADALQAEADAEHGHTALAEVRGSRRSRGRHRPGGPGPGEMSTASGRDRVHLVEGDRVVAVHDRFGAQLTEVLHEVVNERVVVVDHEDAGHGAILPTGSGAAAAINLFARAPVEEQDGLATRRRRRRRRRASPLWFGVAITTCLLVGLLIVVTNYIGLLPGDAENRYLIVGLVFISGGFMMATGYH